MIKGLIFDFDGLILDTETPGYLAWKTIYQEYGVSLPMELWVKAIGTQGVFSPYAYLVSQIKRSLEPEMIHLRSKQLFFELIKEQTILPGVIEYLLEARKLGLKIALASSSDHEWVDDFLKKYSIFDHFSAIKCSNDVVKVKPDPELYLTALQALGIKSNEAIAFEDSPNGIAAAKAAGIFCIAIPNEMTKHLPINNADLQITSLANLHLSDLLHHITTRQFIA